MGHHGNEFRNKRNQSMGNEHLIHQLQQENDRFRKENERLKEELEETKDWLAYWQDVSKGLFYSSSEEDDSDEEDSPEVDIKFKLPQHLDELKLALFGKDCFFILHNLYNEFNKKLKHDDNLSDEESQMLEWVLDRITDEMDAYNITFDMVE